MSYCPKCGNTGFLPITGERCDCKVLESDLFKDVSCMLLPEQFRGIMFTKMLVRTDCGPAYAEYLERIHDEVCSGRWKYKNELICSPAGHSKTILSYSCIQQLFRDGVPTAELQSVDEITNITPGIRDAEYLFVRVPMTANIDTFKRMANLLDVRVRHGGSTFFLYNGSYEQLTYDDKFNILRNIVGDGTYCTLHNSSWRVLKDG